MGPIELRSSQAVSLGEWHEIEASRKGLHGKLTVDGVAGVESARPVRGGSQHLNLVGALYLGGTPVEMSHRFVAAFRAEMGTWGRVQGVQNVPRIAFVKTDAASKTANATSVETHTLAALIFTHALRGTLFTPCTPPP